MVMIGYGHQGEEAAIYVAYYFKLPAGVERRDIGSALFHIRIYISFLFFKPTQLSVALLYYFITCIYE